MVDVVRLSLCMIVRDSAKTLPAALKSVRPWVDELVVVDTGSRDNTREIATSFGARLFEFPWCDDFSAARNESLKHAGGDWLFWMDSDDTISPECGQRLRDLAHGPHKAETLGYVLQVHCPGAEPEQDVTVVDHVKLVRNLPELRFEFRIHEQLLPSIRRLGGQIEWTDIFVTHSGSDHSAAGRQRKQQRDLRLLELELADRPDHPFALFNVGMTLVDMQRHADAIEYLERAIAASAPEESHLRKTFALLIGSLAETGQNEKARELCASALEQFPHDPELWFRRGIVAHKVNYIDEAEAAYRAVFECHGERQFSSRDRGITGFKARHNLALVYTDQGRLDLAEIQWRDAVAEVPMYRPGWQALGQLLIDWKRLVTAEVEAERLVEDAATRPIGLILSAEVAVATGRIDEARRTLQAATEEFTGDADILQAYCKLLFERGPIDEALPHQHRLTLLRPDDPAAYHNLGTLLLRRGDIQPAIAAFERSVELRPGAQHTMQLLAAAKALPTHEPPTNPIPLNSGRIEDAA
ncbi:MAG: tetratricopeptide repeat protein [Planctomycetes bacterium]|nr:tetratricopeptide repeat protein [Planctomycetota bacterium]